MNTKPKEPWRELAQQAAIEEDPDRLLWLMLEINRMWEENETHLSALRSHSAHA
jgi:hypothetical protein